MDSDQGKLFIGGISWETTDEKLIEYFSQYGEVMQTVVMRDKLTGRPRGFGFVVFSDPSVLDRVLQDKHTIDGRTVEAKRALSREEQQTNARSGNANSDRGASGSGNIRTKKIFVGGLPATLSEDGFREYFESYGNVTDVVIMYDQNTQRPRGFGFISFDSEEAVDRVLHKTFHDLNGKQVEVKRALPKDANPGGGGRGMGGGGYQGYGGSGGNSGNAYDGRMDSNRYMQAQNAGGGFGPYGSSGYGAPSYGYGPASSGMGYGGYGGYAGAGTGYGGPAAAYGNPSMASSAYAGGPQGGPRGSWGSQAASGYGAMGYGGVASWGGTTGSGAGGGPGSAPTGHSPSGVGGYGSQGYGYGGSYGGGDGSYGNQGGYSARSGGGTTGGAGGSSGGDMQGNGGYGGYGDGHGNSSYGSAGWKSDQSQGNGPQSGQGGYGSGYGGVQSRQGQQH
ncbi:heterogeneous nuclear ribonucleoprotein 1-like [Punica granatum]|uniref:RRM domain-containing protein n=2 Tax=Punica granatum TaxID=22663 RepID=A0A218VT54_PUNGR|nr:heterogeneous nuclear ribonucleoprotein 1-like [Punica granatum]OWM63270.1 hypothetical protein CDL15_Pgr022015 [Punica granatum]PKI35108.1 hypothetical protein CRG98_044497 [Punica granatum]